MQTSPLLYVFLLLCTSYSANCKTSSHFKAARWGRRWWRIAFLARVPSHYKSMWVKVQVAHGPQTSIICLHLPTTFRHGETCFLMYIHSFFCLHGILFALVDPRQESQSACVNVFLLVWSRQVIGTQNNQHAFSCRWRPVRWDQWLKTCAKVVASPTGNTSNLMKHVNTHTHQFWVSQWFIMKAHVDIYSLQTVL